MKLLINKDDKVKIDGTKVEVDTSTTAISVGLLDKDNNNLYTGDIFEVEVTENMKERSSNLCKILKRLNATKVVGFIFMTEGFLAIRTKIFIIVGDKVATNEEVGKKGNDEPYHAVGNIVSLAYLNSFNNTKVVGNYLVNGSDSDTLSKYGITLENFK